MVKYNKGFLYNSGDIINNEIKIIEKTRHGKNNIKAYKVQSLIYPNAPYYITTEYRLKGGAGCAYKRGLRVCEENSLYSVVKLRKYINEKDSKELTIGSSKKIEVTCPDCLISKELVVKNLVKQGFSCICSKGTSYPERFMIAYLTKKMYNFEWQYTLNDLPNRHFDFAVFNNKNELSFLIECHGLQHYEGRADGIWKDAHKKSKISDKEKSNYCQSNEIVLIELDCRYSDFNYICKVINNCSNLLNIYKDDKKTMLMELENNKNYPINKIKNMYLNDKLTICQIAHKLNISEGTVNNLLRRIGVKFRSNKKKVRCIETGKIYHSVNEAMRETGIKNISRSCLKNTKSGGFHWEYVEEGH